MRPVTTSAPPPRPPGREENTHSDYDTSFISRRAFAESLESLGADGLYDTLQARYDASLQDRPAEYTSLTPPRTALCIALTLLIVSMVLSYEMGLDYGSRRHARTVQVRVVTRTVMAPYRPAGNTWFLGSTEEQVRAVQGAPSKADATDQDGTTTWVYYLKPFRPFQKMPFTTDTAAIDYVEFDKSGRVMEYANRTGLLKVR